MQYSSREVDSTQKRVHPRLQSRLQAYTQRAYEKPVSAASHSLFLEVARRRSELGLPLILDSGCGNGDSTRLLARQYPGHLLIGVDKSAHRLARGGSDSLVSGESNYLLVRMELSAFWRLAHAHAWTLARHFILYPNPWPKARHLKRRWHAHPVFPCLLGLGGELEMRCNWRLFAEEFQAAVHLLSPATCSLESYTTSSPLSPFEKKYAASGHQLYRCRARLDACNHRAGVFEPVFPASSLAQLPLPGPGLRQDTDKYT